MKNLDPQIQELLARGVEEITDKKHLKERLLSGDVLRIKHGIDPTGPNIHIGRAAQFMKLKDFQELGHKVVLIIGDFTAQIGDASDKQAMRQSLSQNEVKENMKGYLEQIGKILDIKKTEIHYNSEWLGKLTAQELLVLARSFTAQQMIQRRNFKERWDSAKPIGLHELDYPLLQGLDSVKIKADVELGGFDQLFNLNTGRDVQKIFGQAPQDIITLKMLLGSDGRKMSTSWGNVINITDSPKEQFGKVMSLRDELVADYFELCTRVSPKEISGLPPREAKARLAREIVRIYHGEKIALLAEKEFNAIFRDRQLPSEMPVVSLKEKEIGLLELLTEIKMASSRAEARRLIEQGGVKINSETQENWEKVVRIKKGMIVQVGKRKFVKII